MKTNLNETEGILKEHVERRELIMDIVHEQFSVPTETTNHTGGIVRQARAITHVALYHKRDKMEIRKGTITPVVMAKSICSWCDPFSKKVGRVKAGYRALRYLEELIDEANEKADLGF